MKRYRAIKIVVVSALALLAALAAWSGARETGGQDEKSYSRLFEGKGGSVRSAPSRASDAFDERFDVLHYIIDIDVNPALHLIAGAVEARVLVTGIPLDSLFFHLKETMAVDSVLVDGVSTPFAHMNDRIEFALDGGHAVDDSIVVRVHYNGYPVDQGLRFRSESIYNVSEPDMARNWFPCHDEPWDKATGEMIVTVPDTLYCASNGTLQDVIDNFDGTKTYHWETRYPLTTYTISVAIARYETFSYWYRYAGADSMEMPCYVHPEKLADAMITFSNTPAMMQFFSGRFGEYPFLQEKYGTAAVQMNGAMENFTCTIIDRRRVDGTLDHDWVLAHEMAHSWFGNSVTMRDWSHIWLNEGFAAFADALWAEETGGSGAYRDRMAFFKSEYFTEDASTRFPVYDPDFLWGATVYEKGAWVLHMLRYLMGDVNFFESLRQYHGLYQYESVTTEQFRSVCESVSGIDLSSFFSEWVYQAGYPEYQLSWSYESDGGVYDVAFRLEQLQENAPVFTIPVEVVINTAAGDTLMHMMPLSADEFYFITLSTPPTSVSFDPDEWILKTFEEVPSSSVSVIPLSGLFVSAYPNPGDGREVRFDFFLPRSETVIIELYDALGRRVEEVLRERRPALWNSVYWSPLTSGDGTGGSGVYFYRLRAGRERVSGKLTLIR
jgi:aminopeptidase N